MKNLGLILLVAAVMCFSCHLEEIQPVNSSAMASFIFTNNGCIAPCGVAFTNTSVDADSFEWDFGDGSLKSNEINPTHTYSIAGDYFVSLRATGKDGSDIETKSIKINALTFEKAFGLGFGVSVKQTADEGYAVVGFTDSMSHGGNDAILMKFNKEGTLIWNMLYGGTKEDIGNSFQVASDGSYIIAGNTESIGVGMSDVYLVKAAPIWGTDLWSKRFGGVKDDFGYSVQITRDGGYIISGLTYSYGEGGDIYLIKTFADGTEKWTTHYGGTKEEKGYSVRQATDGGYIVAGYTESLGAGGRDVFVVKTDSNGVYKWGKPFGGMKDDVAACIQKTTDNGYIIAGSTYSKGAGDSDMYLIKIDSIGNFIWDKTLGGIGYDEASEIQQTSDGGYIIVGSTESYGIGFFDVYLVKTDNMGNEQWKETFGSVDYDLGLSVQQTKDGGYIICGGSLLIKTDKYGKVQ